MVEVAVPVVGRHVRSFVAKSISLYHIPTDE